MNRIQAILDDHNDTVMGKQDRIREHLIGLEPVEVSTLAELNAACSQSDRAVFVAAGSYQGRLPRRFPWSALAWMSLGAFLAIVGILLWASGQ